MKTIWKAFLVASLMLVGAFANAQTFCNNVGSFDIDALYYDGENVVVDYTLNLVPNVVASCGCDQKEALVITTAIERNNNKEIVEVLIVNGPYYTAKSAWLEERCYAVTDNVKYVTAPVNQPAIISSQYVIPAEDWVVPDTYLTVTTQKYTVPKCLTRLCGPENVAPVDFTVDPVWAKVPTPAVDPSKHLETTIYFPVNITTSVEDYLENAETLNVLQTLDSPNFEVKAIDIEGWASPEATVAYNQKLSQKRAATMKKLIADKFSFPESVYQTKGNGEYWGGIDNYVNASSDAQLKEWAGKSFNNLDLKEAALKKLAAYKDIFNTVYPRSRFANCKVTYKVITFDADACRALYTQFPDQVSEYEYVALATSSDAVDQAVLADGLKYYPNSQALNDIAGHAAAAAGNYRQAIQYYQKAGDSKEVMNNLGVCYILMGNKAAADNALVGAQGLEEYKVNIKELKKLK